MIRFFPICIIYHGEYLWANVVEKHLSPSTFHISFQDERNISVPDDIIIDTKNGELERAENSPGIDDEMLKLVSAEIEEYLRNHPLSSDFRI
jgi:hypothetical protein